MNSVNFKRIIKFQLVGWGGTLVNLSVLWALTKYLGVHYLVADIIGMLGGPVLKFWANEFLIFRRKSPIDGEI